MYLRSIKYNIFTIGKDAHGPSWKEIDISIKSDICI